METLAVNHFRSWSILLTFLWLEGVVLDMPSFKWGREVESSMFWKFRTTGYW